jgi:hypothetical protein
VSNSDRGAQNITIRENNVIIKSLDRKVQERKYLIMYRKNYKEMREIYSAGF